MGLKTTADYVHACRVAKQVIDEWDPYSLRTQGAPEDEFEPLAAAVVCYIPRMSNGDDAARAIAEVFSAAFEPQSFSPDQCRDVGIRLFEALAKAGLVGPQEKH